VTEDTVTTENRLRELLEEATPGPWKAVRLAIGDSSDITLPHPEQGYARIWAKRLGDADAALIVALRNAAPFLLDVVEAAKVIWTDTRGYPSTSSASAMYITRDAIEGLREALAKLDNHFGDTK
jgi:hypothetical protein